MCHIQGLHYLPMSILWLAQAAQPKTNQASPEGGLFSLLLISALLLIGMLVLIGLIVAWRNHIRRQRELEYEHEERMADVPRADAWSTAAQRIDAPEADPDEAHIAHEEPPPEGYAEDDEPEDDDDDEFPFDLDGGEDDDDDDGPIGRA